MAAPERGTPEGIRTPSPADIAQFSEVVLSWQDPNNLTLKQAHEFDQVGQNLMDGGMPFAGVVNLWWTLRPDYNRPQVNGKPISPELFAEIMTADDQARKRQEAERERLSKLPLSMRPSINPLMETDPLIIEMHRAVIQQAAVLGKQVVIRTTRKQLEESGLSAHIPPASRRRPLYPER